MTGSARIARTEPPVIDPWTREQGLAHARRWREANKPVFDALYPEVPAPLPPAEAYQIEDQELLADELRSIARFAAVVAACGLIGGGIVCFAAGWALRGWIGG